MYRVPKSRPPKRTWRPIDGLWLLLGLLFCGFYGYFSLLCLDDGGVRELFSAPVFSLYTLSVLLTVLGFALSIIDIVLVALKRLGQGMIVLNSVLFIGSLIVLFLVYAVSSASI